MKNAPIATWNSRKDLWEVGQMLIFGHSDVFSETLPTSGMTRDGQLYGLPTLEHPTIVPGYSSLHGRVTVFSTPDTMPDAPNSGSNMKSRPPGLGNQVKTLQTPNATMGDRGAASTVGGKAGLGAPPAGGPEHCRGAEDGNPTDTGGGEAFPHPADNGHERAWPPREGGPGFTDCHNRAVEWGEYAPAVRLWERIVGPAPAPTELNSKGKPQLNPEFASWMMGLPAGHVTAPEIGLTRAQQLKAIGNGVVPQQAAEALKVLLGVDYAAS